MRLALYTVWFLLPVVFFVLALWAKLEQAGGDRRTAEAGDLVRQGIFVLTAAGVSLALDVLVLIPAVEPLLPEWLPLGVLEVALFPAVLFIQALILGPSKEISLTRRSKTQGGNRPC